MVNSTTVGGRPTGNDDGEGKGGKIGSMIISIIYNDNKIKK